MSNIKLIENYSEKSFIVIGDTKPVKSQLKEFNGRFNAYLTVNGKKVAGWVFGSKKLKEVKDFIESLVPTIKLDKTELKEALNNSKPQPVFNYSEELKIYFENELSELKYNRSTLIEQNESIEESHPDVIICNNMPKILTSSAINETGTRVGCKKDINISLISNNGPTVEKASETIFEDFFVNGEFGYDCQDIRNIIIDILLIGKRNFLKSITKNEEIEVIDQRIKEIELKLNNL